MKAIRDLQRSVRSRGKITTSSANGSIELGFLRGFHLGYLQAMRDAESGNLDKEHAMQPSRADDIEGYTELG